MGAPKVVEGTQERFKSGHLTCEFENINSPGTYVDHRTGSLFRIPPDAVVAGRSPVLEMLANQPWIVTKISDDPYLAVTKARMIAADIDLYVNF